MVDTRKLTISIPKDKRQAVLHTLRTVWYKKRKSYTIKEVTELLETIGDIIQTTHFGKYLYIALQHSIYKALKFNTQFIFSSPKFARFIKYISSKDKKVASFFQSKVSKEIWNVKTKYFIN